VNVVLVMVIDGYFDFGFGFGFGFDYYYSSNCDHFVQFVAVPVVLCLVADEVSHHLWIVALDMIVVVAVVAAVAEALVVVDLAPAVAGVVSVPVPIAIAIEQ
jgi:hypothetical protein